MRRSANRQSAPAALVALDGNAKARQVKDMAGSFASFIIAGLAFHGTHIALSSTRLRGNLSVQIGERGFLGLYSLVAIATFAWFATAYAHAPELLLWQSSAWMAYVPIVLVPFACILLIGGYTTPNPTAVGMERAAGADDPAPGILRITRHPVLWGIGIWALAHLVPNGDLASLLFFGSIAALALVGTVLIDGKKRLALGSNWSRLAEVTSNIPFAAIFTGRSRLRAHEIGLLRLVAGLLLYAVLFLAHPLYTGHMIMIP
jgi:uncharacterized membrane protein